jgi:cell division protein FtsQ
MTPSNRRVRPPVLPVPSDYVELPAPAAPPVAPQPPSAVLSVLRTMAGVGLVTGASLGLAWAARRHVLTSRRFAVTAIEVDGNARRASEAIATESGLSVGANIFATDLDAARTRLLADPWILDAALARRLPTTLVIRVTERVPAALVALDETYLATADGEPFKVFEPGDPVDLAFVTGISAESVALDREGAAHTIQRAIDLAAEFDRTGLGKRAPLQEVHVGGDGSFTLVIGQGAMRVALGGPPFRRKLDQAVRVVAELDKRGAKADAILLDNDTRPERVVVRMR